MFGRGALTGFAATTFNGNVTMGPGTKLILDTSTSATDCPLQFAGDPNTGIRYSSADIWQTIGGGGVSSTHSSAFVTVTGIIGDWYYYNEVTAPSPIANKAILYGLDVAAKTQLTVLFPTGAAEQIAIED